MCETTPFTGIVMTTLACHSIHPLCSRLCLGIRTSFFICPRSILCPQRPAVHWTRRASELGGRTHSDLRFLTASFDFRFHLWTMCGARVWHLVHTHTHTVTYMGHYTDIDKYVIIFHISAFIILSITNCMRPSRRPGSTLCPHNVGGGYCLWASI